MDEDVSFKDTIIIFTSNAGCSLYEGEAKQNAAGIPRKTILNALETEKNPQTGQPFFPAAITSHCLSNIVFCGCCGEFYRRIHRYNRGKKSIV